MVKKFKGIKYSPATDIFYKFIKNDLYRFGVYKDSSNASALNKWVSSDFKDMEGRSSTWKPATKEQINRFSLNDPI